MRRHIRKKLEFDGSNVPVRWQAYGVNFYMQYKVRSETYTNIFVVLFRDLTQRLGQPESEMKLRDGNSPAIREVF